MALLSHELKMGRLMGLSCSFAFNGNSVFCSLDFVQSQKHSSLSSLALEPQKGGSRPTDSNKKEVKKKSYLFFIWAAVDSNHRPHPYQGCALTT